METKYSEVELNTMEKFQESFRVKHVFFMLQELFKRTYDCYGCSIRLFWLFQVVELLCVMVQITIIFG